MSENEKNLFRKSSLERVSSPEQLNEYIKVTNPSLIVILVTVFAMILSAMVWIFAGGLPKTVSLEGVVMGNSSGTQKVYSYVSIGDSKRLTEGTAVQICPEYAPREEYGYINGKITSIGDEIVTSQYLNYKFDNPQIILPLITAASKESNLIEIEMEMGDWSNENGKNIEIVEGTLCEVSAIVGETKPYELIFK